MRLSSAWGLLIETSPNSGADAIDRVTRGLLMTFISQTQGKVESRGRLNQSEVTEGLREVAEQSPAAGVYFFGQKSDVIGQLGVLVEGIERFVQTPVHGQSFGQPEAA
jgi:UDP-N-acetyl-D-mannosaminuronic acid transferase (WecB/TagA/CpsF family)